MKDLSNFDFNKIQVDPFWNTSTVKELKIHKIHSYPAKFPAFITTKSLEYAEKNNLTVSKVADIFCGCGTTAIEAKRNNIDFWGCDLNPVATLIAKTKSYTYQSGILRKYFDIIVETFESHDIPDTYENASERLKYWYKKQQYNNLAQLKSIIYDSLPNNSKYLWFFLTAFSNILKPTSVWLTKSIKPQVDPNKIPANVLESFKSQYEIMFKANVEIEYPKNTATTIKTNNFLSCKCNPPKVDMVITSPPYVTSYEYADLHQLSTLWLDYVEDYRDLREGSIGSCYHDENFIPEYNNLNSTGVIIINQLLKQYKSKARAVAKYFFDMQRVANKVYNMLSTNGIALFVIGNTEYKGVIIDNAKHLSESLFQAGFKEIEVTKRKISGKILTPYRDARGKFSSNSFGRKVYNEEFILIGRK